MLAPQRRYGLSSLTGLTMAAGLLVGIPAASGAAGVDDVVITGQVVSATASYQTISRNMDPSTLSSVKKLGGAYVELMWWPSDAYDEGDPRGVKPGEPRSLTAVGAALADRDGRYAIGAAPSTAMLDDAARNDGWVNFLAATSHGAHYLLEGVSRRWDGRRWVDHGDERPGMSPKDVHRTVFAKDVSTGQEKYGTNPRLLERKHDANTVAASLSSCLYVHQYYDYKYTNVLEFHNTADADSRWDYGGTADSDVEIGVNYSGSSWSIGGTAHIGTSYGSSIFGNVSTNYGKYISTNFRYDHGYLADAGVGFCDYAGDSFVKASRWEGSGIQTNHDVSQYDCNDSPQINYRERYQIGQGFTKNSARAAKFGIGVSFPFVNLGVTSGYSSRVDMTWEAKRNWIYICGGNAYPAYASVIYTY
ncbi:hypothetical protein QEZ54_01910 [Catellatospora sp. KI3]|uniref:hypothetical protein n=1 Tax=Catellatospora sp. KI3 TaxID=3041620 RepID=UPI0024831E21|nr:hypothetical protein [Catellatospora sp. KI3]MDI1459713.1 hypothetical protein [Catellatospora sp. KI3]